MDPWLIRHLRWFKLRSICHLLTIVEDPHWCCCDEGIHDIPNNMSDDQWVPRHIEHGVIWENGILVLLELCEDTRAQMWFRLWEMMEVRRPIYREIDVDQDILTVTSKRPKYKVYHISPEVLESALGHNKWFGWLWPEVEAPSRLLHPLGLVDA